MKGEGEKYAKSEVQYGPGKRTERCFLCEHYIDPRQCELVEGRISPDFWCRLFKKRRN